MSTRLVELTFQTWFMEILVSGLNYFVLMRRRAPVIPAAVALGP
jgi:hypothetical protein